MWLCQNRAMTTNPLRLTVAVLVLVASCLPASAGDRYDPGRAAFDTMLNTLITNALRPPYRPPLLPYYAPQPYVPGPVAGALPAPQQRPHSREEWKAAIVAEAQRFCDAYPTDPICHFQDDR